MDNCYKYNEDTRVLAVNGSYLFLINDTQVARIEAGVYQMPLGTKSVQMYSDYLKGGER